MLNYQRVKNQNLKTKLFLKLPDKGSYNPGDKASHSHAGHLHEAHGSKKLTTTWQLCTCVHELLYLFGITVYNRWTRNCGISTEDFRNNHNYIVSLQVMVRFGGAIPKWPNVSASQHGGGLSHLWMCLPR